jgi:hypothetical protein
LFSFFDIFHYNVVMLTTSIRLVDRPSFYTNPLQRLPASVFSTSHYHPPSPVLATIISHSADRVKEISDSAAKRQKYDLSKREDPFSFSLMNPQTGNVRRPTKEEVVKIHRIFPDFTGYRISKPYIILQTSSRPPFTPLTLAGLPAIYSEKHEYCQ